MSGLRPASTAGDLWQSLQTLTQARIVIGRSGDALPTKAVLDFETAQALARDAVHLALETSSIVADLTELGLGTVEVRSSVPDRGTYLRRPDAGRRLSERDRLLLCRQPPALPEDLCVVIGDGLSAGAPVRYAAPVLAALLHNGITVRNPVLIATHARVALGDEIGELLHASAVLVLLGERPGLTTPESLGAYLTLNPRIGRTDAERNCVSNIHANGLSPAAAAHKLIFLLQQARLLGLTGVQLHDEAGEYIALPQSAQSDD